MENIILPEIGEWDRVYHIDPYKDYYIHKFINLTKKQIDIIIKFVKEHKHYYICKEGGNTLILCKPII